MTKIRPARRCHARRTNGEPCRAYAIHGGRVCRAHGGAAPQVRQAATERIHRGRAEAALADAMARFRAERTLWDVERRRAAAMVLAAHGITDTPPERLTWVDLMTARMIDPECDVPEPGPPPLDGRRTRHLGQTPGRGTDVES